MGDGRQTACGSSRPARGAAPLIAVLAPFGRIADRVHQAERVRAGRQLLDRYGAALAKFQVFAVKNAATFAIRFIYAPW